MKGRRCASISNRSHKIRPGCVALGDHLGRSGPRDAERRIVPAHAAFMARNVRPPHLVEKCRVVGQSEEAMRATFRSEYGSRRGGIKLDTNPFAIGGAPRAQIDNDIEGAAADHVNEFCFRVRGFLEVESTQCTAFQIFGEIELRRSEGNCVRGEFLRTVDASKGTARIAMWLCDNPVGAGNGERLEDHGLTSSCGIAVTNRPPQPLIYSSCD